MYYEDQAARGRHSATRTNFGVYGWAITHVDCLFANCTIVLVAELWNADSSSDPVARARPVKRLNVARARSQDSMSEGSLVVRAILECEWKETT